VPVGGSGPLTVTAGRLEEFARERRPVPGLTVGLVGPGGWRHELAVGVVDAASGRPLAADALMPVASIGKAMTAVALLREHDAGRLDLDAPVHDHLPWLPLATPFGPISVRHLLAHTAGIIGGMEGSPSPTMEAMALEHTPPGWPPGERASYSNVGYAVLGLVLERVAGCSYAEAIQRHVLDPCAMTGSEAVTTAADLGRFLRAVVAGDPPLLEPGTREAMLTLAIPLPEGRSYGYGLGVELDTEAGYRRAGHQGDCPGYHGYAYGCLETGVGVVALANGPWRPPADPAGVWAVVDHGLALLRAAALGLDPPPDPPPAAPDPAGGSEPPAEAASGELPGELAALVGTYAAFNPWIPLVRVRPTGAGLVLVWPDGDDETPLTPLPGGGFRVGDDPASPDRVHFTAVVEGRPMRAVVSGWPYDRVD